MSEPIKAFPTLERFERFDEDAGKYRESFAPAGGMHLRDYFAAKAMQAEIITTFSDATPESARAFAEGCVRDGETPEIHLAKNAYKVADAMLQVRGGLTERTDD